nr:hypothetical protein BN993_00531 [Virgibacillus halodenitrificans]
MFPILKSSIIPCVLYFINREKCDLGEHFIPNYYMDKELWDGKFI